MFYKQPWSSISADIINDKRPNSTRPKRLPHYKSFYLLLTSNG